MDCYALIEEWSDPESDPSDPDESLIFFRELPGCFVSAPTTPEALQKAPEVIADYIGWLQQQHLFEEEEDISSINLVVKEILRAKTIGPRFASDLSAPTDQELDHALRVAVAARAMLIGLYNDVLPADRSRAATPGEWSLTEHLEHLLKAEAYYVGCLSDQVPEALPPVPEMELAIKLSENGRTYETALRAFSVEQRSHLFVHGEAEWTLAKTLRRMTKHLREHYPWMQEIARQVSTHS